MSTEETTSTATEETVDTTVNNETETAKEEAIVEPIIPITDPVERTNALLEIQTLTSLINTTYYLPKWDAGNKGRQQPKVTGSTPLNYFDGQTMQKWGERIKYLTDRLA